MEKERSQANSRWRRSGPPWPWRYPWISVGVLGTDGGHLGRLPLYFPPPPPLQHILLLSICSLLFVSSFAERSTSRFFLFPLFLSLSLCFIYLFFWAGGRSLSLGAPAGWLPARRWTMLLRILLLSKHQRSTTSCSSEHTVTYHG